MKILLFIDDIIDNTLIKLYKKISNIIIKIL
jgi:hypothetical protein